MDVIDEARRNEALALLQRHWDARTIDPGDHERRTTLVRRAHTQGEVDAALQGLPALPVGGVRSVAPFEANSRETAGGASVAGAPTTRGELDLRDDGRTHGVIKVSKQLGDTLQVLVPLLCVGAFFVLHTGWPVFLLIPIVMVLIHGGGPNDDAEIDEDSRRARRELKRKHRRDRR